MRIFRFGLLLGMATFNSRAITGIIIPRISSDSTTTANATSNSRCELGTPVTGGIITGEIGTAPPNPTN
ncbi:hypothetical protein [Neisseria polysaccharea]|uniref:hypothetical protein n=1 Tax=Neisseria polysaccharea TaxID=489 RepID=UPI0018C41C38